jgi:HSP20 family molecular chaperone IbpA
MAEVATEVKSNVEVKTDVKPKYWAIPEYSAWVNADQIKLEVELPGVRKETISLKTERNSLVLRARRNDIQYELDLDFIEDIEPEKTKAKYEEGLLTIELKRYNPMEHAVDIKIE